jgi:lipopolysaccharide export system protein LptA
VVAFRRSLLAPALCLVLLDAAAQDEPLEETDDVSAVTEESPSDESLETDSVESRLGAFEFFEFDSSQLDRSRNTMTFEGFRIFGENWSITAEKAVANADELGLDSGQIEFSGNLDLQLATASLEAERAMFEFREKQLILAELSGDPVAFVDHATPEHGAACGSATTLRYDDGAGTFEMRGSVSLTVGPYRTTGCDLIYYLGQEEFRTGPAQCDEPFRTTIVPEADVDTACDSGNE